KRARALLEELIATLPAGARRADALRIVGEIRYQDDSFPEAVRLWRQALGEAGDDPRLRPPLETQLGYAHRMMAAVRSAKPHAWPHNRHDPVLGGAPRGGRGALRMGPPPAPRPWGGQRAPLPGAPDGVERGLARPSLGGGAPGGRKSGDVTGAGRQSLARHLA